MEGRMRIEEIIMAPGVRDLLLFAFGVCAVVAVNLIVRLLCRPKKDDHEPLSCSIRKSYVVQLLIDDLRNRLQCDRVSIIHFGNGQYLHGRVPAQKATITYESIGKGVPSIRNNFIGLPITIFPKWTINLLDKKFYAIKDTADDEHAILRGLGDKSTYMAALDDQDDNIFGALVVHYTKCHHVMGENEVDIIARETNKISGAMLCSKYTTNVFDKEKSACGTNCICAKKKVSPDDFSEKIRRVVP
jgi:hypothetical protein